MNLTFKHSVLLVLIAVGAVSAAYYALSPYHDCMRLQSAADEGELNSFHSMRCISGTAYMR